MGHRRRQRAPREFREVTLELVGLSHLGGAVGRLEEMVYFVAHGLPGERVVAKVVREHGSYARAETTEVLRRCEADRAAPPCPYFGRCGGCAWQHARYERQLAYKTLTVREQLARLGGFDDPPLRPMIGATEPYHYRNHVRLSSRRDGTLGFTREQSHAVLTIEHCHIALPEINAMLARLQGVGGRKLHQVALRHSVRTGQSLVTPRVPDAPIETGQRYLEDEVLGRRFRIGANSFFQVNTRPVRRPLPESIAAPWIGAREGDWSQADILALLALDRLAATPGETILDAYCGVGTFALLAAERLAGRGRVVAIEWAHQAVEDARHNAAGLANVELIQGGVEKVLPELDLRPDGVILDPARAGCDRAVLDALLARRPGRIVYVSCDPSTLARDLRILVDGGYGLREVQPVDMFPQTAHIECVATLER
jgi:23S rRNA (uracil1939-C5)-methyltransferase